MFVIAISHHLFCQLHLFQTSIHVCYSRYHHLYCLLHLYQTSIHVCYSNIPLSVLPVNTCTRPALMFVIAISHHLFCLLTFVPDQHSCLLWQYPTICSACYTCTRPAFMFVIAISHHLLCLLHLFQTSSNGCYSYTGPAGLLSYQPRVSVTSYFVYKAIRDLESTDHLFINPIHRKGLINKRSFNSR